MLKEHFTLVPTLSKNDYAIFSKIKSTETLKYNREGSKFFEKYNDNTLKQFKFINKYPYYKVAKIKTQKIAGMIIILLLQIFEMHVKMEDNSLLKFLYNMKSKFY